MLVELHLLQNFAPSNLNRDDTGSPKECEFGGFRRARISSQCFKRAVRTEFRQTGLIEPQLLAERTKRAAEAIAGRLATGGFPAADAQRAAAALLTAAGFGVQEGKTEYLLFLSSQELDAAARVAATHWDALLAAAEEPDVKKGASPVSPEAKQAILEALQHGQAADLALFGRMIVDLPDGNVEAACQVAHAISTNRVSVEFDFFTAIDDLKPEGTPRTEMLGTVEFNSACFYRYANVDMEQLTRNLEGNRPLAARTLGAFLRASVDAVPTGKQHSMAAHNPPSLVMAVVRDTGQWNLANAFLRPVQPGQEADLMERSIVRLDAYWSKLVGMYGSAGITGIHVATTEPERLEHLAPHLVTSPQGGPSQVDGLIALVTQAAQAAQD